MGYLPALTLLLAPTYAWRFGFLDLPLNFLMVWQVVVWLLVLYWMFKNGLTGKFLKTFQKPNRVMVLSMLWFVVGVVSLFISGITQTSAGQFVVLFFQPIVTFWLLSFLWNQKPNAKIYFITASYIFVAACGIYAVVQYYTLIGIPPKWWGNSIEPKRALAFFTHPNGFALFVAPLLAFLLPQTFDFLSKPFKALSKFEWQKYISQFIFWTIGAIGLFLSLSRGGWIALFIAGLIYTLIRANKRLLALVFVGAILGSMIVYVVPNWRYRVILPFLGQKSVSERPALWSAATKMIKENPVLGKGLNGFFENFPKYNSDQTITDNYPGPHNLFLHLWVDTGLSGLIIFVTLLVVMLIRSWKGRGDPLYLGVFLFLVAMLVHGQIDITYFKNDLAVLFWLIVALLG